MTGLSTVVAALPGVWRCRVSAWTGWPGVSRLGLNTTACLSSNFYLSVTAWIFVSAVP